MRKRKNSFIVIQIMEKLSPDEMIANGLKIINKNETFMRLIYNVQYYIISFILGLLNIVVYYKIYNITDVIIKQANTSKLLHKKQSCENKLIVFDNGVRIYTFFIPYENILRFGFVKEKFTIFFIGKITFGDNSISLNINGNDAIQICFKVDKEILAKNLHYHMKLNMYYHIKYKKINKKVIENYV